MRRLFLSNATLSPNLALVLCLFQLVFCVQADAKAVAKEQQTTKKSCRVIFKNGVSLLIPKTWIVRFPDGTEIPLLADQQNCSKVAEPEIYLNDADGTTIFWMNVRFFNTKITQPILEKLLLSDGWKMFVERVKRDARKSFSTDEYSYVKWHGQKTLKIGNRTVLLADHEVIHKPTKKALRFIYARLFDGPKSLIIEFNIDPKNNKGLLKAADAIVKSLAVDKSS